MHSSGTDSGATHDRHRDMRRWGHGSNHESMGNPMMKVVAHTDDNLELAGAKDIEESLGGSQQVVVDTGKRYSRQGKKFRDGHFRAECRRGDFGCGSPMQPYVRTSVRVPLCERCNKRYPGQCLWAIRACVTCGLKDHQRCDCPQILGESAART
ncbi:hypothetical protein V6N13_007831 [Hibiscus sabdariffa]